MPYSPMKKSCIKMYDEKGKQTGLMMEGSVAYMESDPKAKVEQKKAEQESQRLERTREVDALKQRIQDRRMEQTIARDVASNERRAEVIKKIEAKTGKTYGKDRKQIVTGQQHLQAGVTPLGMHGPGGSHPDPKKKKATTTLKNALASDEDYQIVPGFEERLGGELEGVTLTASAKTNKQERQEKRAANKKERRNTYSKAGIAIKTIGSYLPGGGGKYERRQLEKTARKGLF